MFVDLPISTGVLFLSSNYIPTCPPVISEVFLNTPFSASTVSPVKLSATLAGVVQLIEIENPVSPAVTLDANTLEGTVSSVIFINIK
ncbi:hypothetical protein [Enterobacter sp. 61D5]|uniref:hypothetical protein n=1 Tax=Enterobacter sp. 61D5 TaxID=3077779 RepID=UPI002A817DE1|nr:hypothetical protein [Enterobacter sp. 61D5]